MKYNKTQSKWCKNKHGASEIIDTFETYQGPIPTCHTQVTRGVNRAPPPISPMAHRRTDAGAAVPLLLWWQWTRGVGCKWCGASYSPGSSRGLGMAVAQQWEVVPPPNLAVYFSGEDLLSVAFGWCTCGFGPTRHGARAFEEDRAVALGDVAASMVVGRCPEHGQQVVAMLQLRSRVCPPHEEQDARTAVLRRGCGGAKHNVR
jgi:hypothetical protein